MSGHLLMPLDDPPFLSVGTEVSAKYKGAFCEAKIRKISKVVKCKIQYVNGTVALVSDEVIKGSLKIGATVEVKCSDKKEFVEATIQKIQDCSQYTVVFDDGDITSLKRTALCLKSKKHFAASATLDQLPLTHPEHIGITPIRNIHGRRSQKHKKSLCESGDEDIEELVEKDMGKVICAEYHDKKKIKNNWFPGLIVSPKAQTAIKINVKKEYVVRSFKDGKYFTVLKAEAVTFTKEIAAKVENPTLKTAVEKALLYIDKDELPPHWDRDLLFCGQKNCTATDSEGILCSDNSDEESIEEKDHFVAQLFKYMDDRGTPINQIPVINAKDVDLYKLFKVVFNLGGFNKVSKSKQWKLVSEKIGFDNHVFYVKQSYQQYLHGFEDFYRKLGCTMLSHPRGVRSRSRFSRSIIRDIDKAQPSTSYNSADKNKQSASVKQETNDKKDKPDNDSFNDPLIVTKTAKIIEADDKLCSYKNIDKKKDDSSSSTLRNKSSVKWEPDFSETKDSSRDSKIKKEMLIKEENDETKKVDDQNNEKKKYARNLFGKSMRKTTKKEKNIKLKLTEVGLTGIRKKRSIKEHIKTFVKVMTPFKKSKRGTSNTQQETSNKIKLEEDVPKLTRSKSKEDIPSKIRRLSVVPDNTEIPVIPQPALGGLIVENQNKLKKSDDEKKKKITRKKKDEKPETKMVLTDVISTPISSEVDTSVKGSQVTYGTDLVVYYGDKHTTTYDAKVLNILHEAGKIKYLVHYKGWNSRYDEWIDFTRIASVCPEPEPELDNDADLSKSEQKNVDLKKLSRRSVTPSTSYPHRKKSPINSARPTRTCTLNDRPLSSIGKYTLRDNSDSESEYSGNLGLAKQYNKRNQQALKNIKSEHDIIIKSDLDTDNQKKAVFPKTYPSKEILLQRSVPRKPKSCVFKVHSNKSEEIEICEQVTLKSPFDFNFEMQSHSDSKKSNLDNENIETQKEGANVKDEQKLIVMVSSNDNSEKLDPQQSTSETLNFCNQKTDIGYGHVLLKLPSKNTNIVYYQSSSEDDDQIQLKITKKESEKISSQSNDKQDESKISGTDFDLNKIRSEMKGLMPTSASSTDLIHESFMLDQEGKTENPKTIEPVTEDEDVYEFKDSEPCNFDTISSVIEEKHRRIIKHNDPPKLCTLDKPIELPRIMESIDDNESMDPPMLKRNSPQLFDDIIQEDIKETSYQEHSVITNKIEKSISPIQLDIESNKSKKIVISVVINSPIHTNEIEEDQTCQIEVDESEKNEVLDLCMKPPESPPNNIFSMPDCNEATNNIVVEDEEYEDDDESKLVIAENDKIDNEYQIDTDIVCEQHNTSNGQNEDIQRQSPPPLPQSTHQLPNTGCEFQNAYDIKRDISIPNISDDESTTSCNESIQNDLIHNFHMYKHFENESMKKNSYQSFNDYDDDSTKSGFEFDSSSKSPTMENTEHIESTVKFPIDESNNKLKEYNYEKKNESTKVLPELQCREEIVDEETLNNALVIEYNRKNVEYTTHKHNTNKGFFDSINQPSSSKDSFYETDTSSDTKNCFIEANQANLFKSVIFDTNAPSTSRSDIFDNNISNSITSKSNFYENTVPKSSNNSLSPESDVNNVLLCEETIPGSPTGTLDEQFDQEEKKNMAQTLFEEREAASAMYAMNRSFRRPMITLMGATEEEMEKYTSIIQNDGILDQRHLQFLAEISSRNLGLNVNEPLVTEPSELDPKPIVEQILKSPEKPQTKRKTSNYEHPSSKRNKISTTTSPVADDNIEKILDVKVPISLKDGKPFITFASDMDSSQRQALILSKINDLRKEFIQVKARIAIIDRRRKKIRKRKREMAKKFTINPK